jgi:hypothetical protein
MNVTKIITNPYANSFPNTDFLSSTFISHLNSASYGQRDSTRDEDAAGEYAGRSGCGAFQPDNPRAQRY